MAGIEAGTWVLVADGEKALFLENVTDAVNPKLVVRRMKAQENPPTREQASGAPGRVQDSMTGASRSYGETDWHRLQKDLFADEMAKILYGEAHKGAFDKIVIVAPPQVLGELRSKLHREVSDRVILEIPKTLTKHPLPDIEKLVTEALDEEA